MAQNFRLAFKGSPFFPLLNIPSFIESIKSYISKGFPHASAISLALQTTMETHLSDTKKDQALMNRFQMDEHKLELLILGFRYPLETIIATVICSKLLPSEHQQVYEELVPPSHNFFILRIQDQISLDLKATINLFKIDTSAALIFQHLKDHPVFTHEEFLNGMEIAAILYFGLASDLTDSGEDDSWLRTPYDPTIT